MDAHPRKADMKQNPAQQVALPELTPQQCADLGCALNQHAIMSIADAAGTITFVNDKFCQVSGYRPDELLGHNHRILKSGKHPDSFYAEMWDTISSGKTWQGIVCNRAKDGRPYWVESSIVPFLDDHGLPYQYISLRTDITPLMEIEAHLRAERDFSDAAINALPGIFYVFSAAGRFLKVNDSFSRVTGFSAEEIDHMTPLDFIAEAERGLVAERIQLALEMGKAEVEAGLITKAGETIPYYFQAAALEFNSEHCLIGTGIDFSSLKQAQQALVAAKDEAERASRAKSDFLSSMSHELRTPMNAILGFSQLLEYDDTLNEDQLGSVQEILKAGNHLLDLISEVLNLARIESGNIELSIEPACYAEILDECIALIQPLADARGIRIDAVTPRGVKLRADRMRLKQVLINLMSNAVKYNRPGGSITLRIAPAADDQVRIMVSDNGQGIPAKRMEELFQPFNRLGEENSAIAGTGIGLSISRQLVELMGGSIGAESEAGVGSTFWIELPAEDALPQTDASESTEDAATAEQFTILYVDDNPSNLKHMSKLLARRHGIHLITAHSPAIGLARANEKRPDLIILDINMPGMNGFEVLARLRTEPWAQHKPIVALTANTTERDIQRGMEAGFNDYLVKPLDVPYFLALVDECIKLKK